MKELENLITGKVYSINDIGTNRGPTRICASRMRAIETTVEESDLV